MGAARIDMHRLQEVIRLHRLARSRREIARQLHIGRNTVNAYVDAVSKVGLLDGAPEDLPAVNVLRAVIEEHIPSKQAPQQASTVTKWKDVITRLRDKGAGPKAIHDWLRLHEPDYTGGLSSIKRMSRALDRERGPRAIDVAIPVDTAPGEVAQVDFGYVGKCYDPVRGVMRKAWLFAMTLGFSRRMYLDIVFDQRVETWIELHIRSFEYFGGVPRVIVPDNLKAAVVRAAFAVDDDPAINRSYRELARHYGFQIDPTPPRAPQKKGKVERSVRYAKGNFFATWDSVDINEDRRQLMRWNGEIADHREHGTTGRKPIDLFDESERDALLALPKRRWERVVWKQAKLHRDAHVQVNGAFYSAPWRLLHESLWVRCTPSVIAIYHGDAILCTHARIRAGQRRTVEVHLPEHRRDLRQRSREHWTERAKVIGREVEHLVDEIFGSDDVLLKLRKVQAVVTHLESFPAKRARAAARRALHFGCIDYQGIKNILRKGLDLEALPGEGARAWSKRSTYARRPTETTETLFANQESIHADH